MSRHQQSKALGFAAAVAKSLDIAGGDSRRLWSAAYSAALGAPESGGMRRTPKLATSPRKIPRGRGEQRSTHTNSTRLAGAIVVTILLSAWLIGCGTAPPARPITPGPVAGSAWLDSIIQPGEQLLFAGDNTVLKFSRLADRVRIEVQPVLPPIPRIEMLADSPTGPPLEFQPGWYRIIRWGLGRPYQVEVEFGRRRSAETAPAAEGDFGTVTYFMPAKTQTDHFHAGLVACNSPAHLLLAALGPLPNGETRLLAMRKDGKDYWATLEADPGSPGSGGSPTGSGSRRIVKFPYALLWGQWSDKFLAEQIVFEIDSADRWPDSTIRATNVAATGPIVVRYVRTQRLPSTAPTTSGGTPDGVTTSASVRSVPVRAFPPLPKSTAPATSSPSDNK